MVITALPETVLEQVELATETKVKVCVAVTAFTVTVAVPPAPMVAVVFAPPTL